MSEYQHLKCPCGLSEQFSVNPDNGWGHCFSGSCEEGGKKHNFPPGTYELPPELVDKVSNGESVGDYTVYKPEKEDKPFTPLTTVFRAFPERGLAESTIKHYRVDVGEGDARYLAKYPIFSVEGEHIGNKVRFPDKQFSHEGTSKGCGLWGRHAFPPGSAKAITVTEGQDDAMAVYQMTGSRWPAVSVHSSSTAERDVRADFEYLNSFDSIYFVFDDDEAGRKASKAVANIGFPIGKVKVLTLRKHKDPNDYLRAKDSEAFSREWWNAPTHKPDGLILGTEGKLWDNIVNRKESFTIPYPFEGLNKMTFGMRLSEFVLIAADPKIGKTTFVKHLEHAILTNEEVKEQGYGIGFLHFEEPNGDTALGLLSIHNGVPYHIPTAERPEEELRKAYDELLNTDRVVIWDHFGSNSVDAVLDKIRHMAALGCKYIVLDHLSIVVSDQSGDERKQLDEISTKLKTLTMELDICLIAVIHTNRQGGVRGSAGPEQLANIVMRLSRNKLDKDEWRRNITVVTITDNRFCGYTGPAAYLYYNNDTARMSELDEVEAGVYENGGSGEEPWG